jgi:formylglycine-generating enzyme required for sulfatase activity
MLVSKTVVSVAAIVGVLAGTAVAANIETVPVGNPGNAADTRYESPGYGSIGYTYNIGKYEVTAGQYMEFLNKVAGVDTYGLYNTNMWSDSYGCKIERYAGSGTVGDPYQYRVAGDRANRPVNYVSWGDSARFANWLHNNQPAGAQGLATTEDGAYYLNGATSNAALLAVNRESDWKWAITSEDEWYKAAYYNPATGNYYDYPTSSNSVPGRDLNDVSGNNANYYGDPFPIDSPYYTTVAGEFQNSDSPYGTFDQGGNVWEWNEAVLSGSYRGLRGGSFDVIVGDLLASSRGLNDPSLENYYIGFRVSEVPEPTSMALLAVGGVGMLVRRRGLGR